MTKFRTILVDDQPEQLDLLAGLLSDFPEIAIESKISDPTIAYDKIKESDPDLIFLDIEMPVKDGFKILDELKTLQLNAQIIFVTAYNKFAIKAFEYAAFDYLLKPVDPSRIAKTIQRLKKSGSDSFRQKTKLLLDAIDKLTFRTLTGYVFINPKEIIYIEAKGNYSIFHIDRNNSEMVTSTIGEIEKQLDPNYFFKTHRSYIINLNFIEKINYSKGLCILHKSADKFHCKISKANIPVLVDLLK